MSQKKLQQDIDKLLKKVREGLDEFETIHDKFQITDPSNSSYREKLEGDLKREIKKLQKQREQIKTWLSKEDVKDRSSILLENRKLIENDMEIFKSIEKLMKTKQFSKEALSNPSIILDPRDAQKNEQMVFIQDSLNELQKQIESCEVRLDSNNGSDSTLIEDQIKKHDFHIANLENILKLLQNHEIEPEKIEEFKEDIIYYIENNDDPDFVEYDTLYEDMGFEIQPSALVSSNSVNISDTKLSLKQEKSPKKKKQALKEVPTTESIISTNELQNTITPIISSTSQGEESKKEKEKEKDQVDIDIDFPKDKTDEINKQLERDIEDNDAFKNPLFKNELKFWLESKRTLLQPHKDIPSTMLSQLESSLLNCPDSLDADTPYLYKKLLSLPHPTSIFFPNEPIRFVYPYDINQKSTNSNGNDTSDDNNNKSNNNLNDKNNDNNENRTDNFKDSEYQSNDIYSNTSLAKILTKFDLDTLFFIFYHYQGTYEQFLSARELHKNRNWIFNKVDRCWYYKEIEKLPPGMNKSEEESWRYFDYKKSWLSRRCGPDFIYKEEEFEQL